MVIVTVGDKFAIKTKKGTPGKTRFASRKAAENAQKRMKKFFGSKSKTTKRKTTKSKSPKRKAPKRKAAKRRVPKRKAAKRKAPKRKAAKRKRSSHNTHRTVRHMAGKNFTPGRINNTLNSATFWWVVEVGAGLMNKNTRDIDLGRLAGINTKGQRVTSNFGLLKKGIVSMVHDAAEKGIGIKAERSQVMVKGHRPKVALLAGDIVVHAAAAAKSKGSAQRLRAYAGEFTSSKTGMSAVTGELDFNRAKEGNVPTLVGFAAAKLVGGSDKFPSANINRKALKASPVVL